MSDSGSHAAGAPENIPFQGGSPAPAGPQRCGPERCGPERFGPGQFTPEQFTPEQFTPEQFTPEQRYDVPQSAQQYGQPPATGYQPPAIDPPGQSAPVTGNGPQQYGQPEHGQASYAQEGFPAPGPGTGGYQPTTPGYGQPPVTGVPVYGPPGQGSAPQAPPYEQPPYPSHQPYAGQGYPPQPYLAPAPMSAGDQRLWATLTHLGILVVGFLGPLVAYLVLKDRSPFLRASTTEALNFSITVTIATVISSILFLVVVGYVLLPIVYVAALVLCILAAIAANKGEVYRYPLSWRLV